MKARFILVLFAVLFASGCSIMAPEYSISVENQMALKNTSGQKVKVGVVGVDGGDEAGVNSFSMRGSSLNSPYGTFAKYLEQALTIELKQAERLDMSAPIMLTAILIRNEVDAAGISIGTSDIEAEFTLEKAGQNVYQKVHAAHNEWKSSFAGAVALPAAQQNYPVAVQKLLASLFNDPEFIEALK